MYSQDKNDRVAIFIDGENIHYSAKHMNMRLDYLKMCKRLVNGRKLVRAHFYTAISNQSEGKIDFVNFLRLNGFKVVTQEIKVVEDDGVEQKFYRGNLDLDMAVDIYELLPHVDTIILCTGDGDFIRVVDSVGRKGIHVEVCALREMTSTELIACCDSYMDLDQIRADISLEGAEPIKTREDFKKEEAEGSSDDPPMDKERDLGKDKIDYNAIEY